MSNRYKGFLVTLSEPRKDEDCEDIITALKQIKGVQSVKPYINGFEDWMMYEKGIMDFRSSIYKFLSQPIEPPTDEK